jgi:hypothetical protein
VAQAHQQVRGRLDERKLVAGQVLGAAQHREPRAKADRRDEREVRGAGHEGVGGQHARVVGVERLDEHRQRRAGQAFPRLLHDGAPCPSGRGRARTTPGTAPASRRAAARAPRPSPPAGSGSSENGASATGACRNAVANRCRHRLQPGAVPVREAVRPMPPDHERGQVCAPSHASTCAGVPETSTGVRRTGEWK